MKKQYKSPIIKNHEFTKKKFLIVFPLKLSFEFAPEIIKALLEYPVTNDI